MQRGTATTPNTRGKTRGKPNLRGQQHHAMKQVQAEKRSRAWLKASAPHPKQSWPTPARGPSAIQPKPRTSGTPSAGGRREQFLTPPNSQGGQRRPPSHSMEAQACTLEVKSPQEGKRCASWNGNAGSPWAAINKGVHEPKTQQKGRALPPPSPGPRRTMVSGLARKGTARAHFGAPRQWHGAMGGSAYNQAAGGGAPRSATLLHLTRRGDQTLPGQPWG